ncbi:MAG: GNAT family N-acetyltransferase [Anaerolineales bacterium]
MNFRPYEGLHDLHAMLDLLSDGCRAKNGTHYAHRGDLQWWLFYTDTPEVVWRPNIRLWVEGERLMGFALLSFEEKTCDVFIHPELRGTQQERELMSYALNEMSAVEDLQVMWISDQDTVRIRWLEQSGFACQEEYFVYFTRSLSDPVLAPVLPAGFSLRHSHGEEDAKLRSVASHAAFSQHRDFEGYWPRTLRFMQSPVYVPEHERFVISPNGDVASFCILWTDEINKLGHFEPVGTHPDYQRNGFSRALLYDSMRQLRSEGMIETDVCTTSTNLPAIHLYESVGFTLTKRLLEFRKRK